MPPSHSTWRRASCCASSDAGSTPRAAAAAQSSPSARVRSCQAARSSSDIPRHQVSLRAYASFPPAGLDLVAVLRVVEPVEHVVRHELAASFHRGDRPFDRRDLPRQPLPLPPAATRGGRERPHLGLPPGAGRRRPVTLPGGPAVERLADRGEAETEVAQEQDPLEPDERVGVVVAVAVRRDPARAQDPDRVVVTQRAARRPGQARDLLDGPVGRAGARRAHLPLLPCVGGALVRHRDHGRS